MGHTRHKTKFYKIISILPKSKIGSHRQNFVIKILKTNAKASCKHLLKLRRLDFSLRRQKFVPIHAAKTPGVWIANNLKPAKFGRYQEFFDPNLAILVKIVGICWDSRILNPKFRVSDLKNIVSKLEIFGVRVKDSKFWNFRVQDFEFHQIQNLTKSPNFSKKILEYRKLLAGWNLFVRESRRRVSSTALIVANFCLLSENSTRHNYNKCLHDAFDLF